MALRNIVTEGDPILRKRSREIEEISGRRFKTRVRNRYRRRARQDQLHQSRDYFKGRRAEVFRRMSVRSRKER